MARKRTLCPTPVETWPLLCHLEFDYRVEIFMPKPQRRWGYYVLPFLLSDRLVARVDLKAERTESRLQVLAAYLEAHAQAGPVDDALAAELLTMARWLGLFLPRSRSSVVSATSMNSATSEALGIRLR